MLDIKFIRENKDIVQAGAKKKHIDFDVEELLKLDDSRRTLLQEVEEMRAEQNKAAAAVAQADENSRAALIAESKSSKEALQKKEEELKSVMQEWQKLMIAVPNIPDMSVPEGESEEDNKEIRVWGDKPEFSFTPKDHVELMKDLDLADFERGVKVSGFRGYFLKNEGALISFALWQYTLDTLIKKGFIPMIVPALVRRESMLGTGYIPQGEEDIYQTQDEDYLTGTGEVATMGYHADEVLDKSELPKKFLSFSPCYRREIGSHGKDTKGLVRVHEFFKMEQVVLCEASHETSVQIHEELTLNAEEIMQALKLPYHVVINAGGDLGLGQVKKYDIEAWMPSEDKYRETHSSSYFHDFQTRRLNIKYKEEDGTTRFTHSLNNTAVATPRIVGAILENYQQEDGSIKVPEVLQKYIGKEIIR